MKERSSELLGQITWIHLHRSYFSVAENGINQMCIIILPLNKNEPSFFKSCSLIILCPLKFSYQNFIWQISKLEWPLFFQNFKDILDFFTMDRQLLNPLTWAKSVHGCCWQSYHIFFTCTSLKQHLGNYNVPYPNWTKILKGLIYSQT